MLMNKIFFILIIISKLFDNIKSQNLNLQNPCPNVFQYYHDGYEWFGIIKIIFTTIPINPLTTELTTFIHTVEIPTIIRVKIILSQKGRLPSNYLGEIELLNYSRKNSNINHGKQIQQILDNDNNSSLIYKINFPNGQRPPRVTEIYVNDKLLCYGTPDIGIVVTSIDLEHIRKFPSLPREMPILPSTFSSQNEFLFYHQPPTGQLISPMKINNMTNINCGEITATKKFTTSDRTFVRGSWPWLAAIYINNLTTLSYQCSGNIISSRIIISVAHCLYNKKPNDILIFLGRFNLKDWSEENSLAVSIENIYIHTDFDEKLRTYDADIAIIILNNDVQFNDYIRPICLWTGSTDIQYIENEQGYVAGWKYSNNNNNNYNNYSIIPKLFQPIVITNEKCIKYDEKLKNLISERNFCTENENLNENTYGLCYGYSGSGLMILKNKKFVLRGIVSGTIPSSSSSSQTFLENQSCNINKITIFTDVTKFLNWITAFLL